MVGHRIVGYCEPFMGMLGVGRHIPELFQERFPKRKFSWRFGDVNASVVKMWKKSMTGWVPPTKVIGKDEYDHLRRDGKSSARKGYYGHALSFRAVFCTGYMKRGPKAMNKYSNRIVETAKALLGPNARGEPEFKQGSYTNFSHLKDHVIYCDPPYAKFSQRYTTGVDNYNCLKFDSEAFWAWCIQMAQNNVVLVSEYSAPEELLKSGHLTVIWEHVDKKNPEKVEKLYFVTG